MFAHFFVAESSLSFCPAAFAQDSIQKKIHVHIHMICGGRARPRGPGGSIKYQFVYKISKCSHSTFKWIGFCMFKWPGGPRKTFPEVYSLKYLLVYFRIRIFKCSYRIHIHIHVHVHVHIHYTYHTYTYQTYTVHIYIYYEQIITTSLRPPREHG